MNTFPVLGGGPVTRPQITDKGQVVARLPNNFITLYTDAAEQKAFATSADGFAATGVTTGPSPDVSADGRVVAFMGDRGKGNGVFLSYFTGDTRHVVRVAGEGQDGWTNLDLNSPVRISGSLTRDRGLTVAFEGKHNLLGEGVYSSRVSFYSKRGNDFRPGQIVEVEVAGAVPVLRVNDFIDMFLTR